MLIESQSRSAKNDIRKRQHLMERSFAQSERYGYKRARWRRLWRAEIQEYLTASIQNIMVLIRNIKEQSRAIAAKLNRPRPQKPFSICCFLNQSALVRQSLILVPMLDN